MASRGNTVEGPQIGKGRKWGFSNTKKSVVGWALVLHPQVWVQGREAKKGSDCSGAHLDPASAPVVVWWKTDSLPHPRAFTVQVQIHVIERQWAL